jgi:hypothetical protein
MAYQASALTQNPNYLVSISRGAAGSNLTVKANATAKFAISIENRWVNILEALGVSTEGGGALSTFVAGAQLSDGANFVPIIATSHVWRGSSGFEITLDMRFDAFTNSVQDVITPIETLLAMFSPVRGSGANGLVTAVGNTLNTLIGSGAFANGVANQFLQPPGPTPFSFIQNNGLNGGVDPMSITILIGQTLTIKNLIPTTIRLEMENRFDMNGNPVCMYAQASFISYTVPALNDILAIFNNSTATAAINNTLGLAQGSNPSVATAAPTSSPTPFVSTPTPTSTTPLGLGGIGSA